MTSEITCATGIRIVAIGGSAGALDSFQHILAGFGPHIPFAVVLLQHLDPAHTSSLASLIARKTDLAVHIVEHGQIPQPGNLYVIPENRIMTCEQGAFGLREPTSHAELWTVIDTFFSSIARHCGEDAIGVLVSGEGSDGASGLRDLRMAGALTIVEDPKTALHPRMPDAAVSAGAAELILPALSIGAAILDYVHHLVVDASGADSTTDDLLRRVLELLCLETGHDFTMYKQTTVFRRLERRMAANACNSLAEYEAFLKETPAEAALLMSELLIGVTSFFRDPEAFSILSGAVQRLVDERGTEGRTLRVWVPACSQGEEAFTIAIIFAEILRTSTHQCDYQIFASDINAASVDYARRGLYPDRILDEVSADLLERYFTVDKNGYRIAKSIRDRIIFAQHSVIADPPYSHLDLVSCRNLLIYLNAETQVKLLSVFGYALLPGGYLLLGSSESAANPPGLFGVIDKKWKLYHKIGSGRPAGLAFGYSSSQRDKMPITHKKPVLLRDITVSDSVRKMILDGFAPSAVLVSETGTILYIQGNVSGILEHPAGRPSDAIADNLRESLRMACVTTLRNAVKGKTRVASEPVRSTCDSTVPPLRITATPARSSSCPVVR